MKKLIAALVVCMIPAFASAQSAQSANSKAGSHSAALSGSSLVQNYAGGVRYSGSYKINNVPALGTVIATPTAPCMGAVGGQLALAGFGGGFASSVPAKTCNKLEEIRATWNMRQYSTALVMMCTFKNYRHARAILGKPCPTYYDKNKHPVVHPAAATIPAPPPAAPEPAPVEHASIPAWKQKLCSENPVKPSDKPYVDYYCKN